MTGGSLGGRGSSNGSLHHYGKLSSNAARKPSSKVSSQSSREKERVFLVICRCFGRAEVAMLLLVALSLLVIIWGTFSVSKESTGRQPNDLMTYTRTLTSIPPPPPLSTLHRHRFAVSETGHDFCKKFPLFSPPPPSRRLLGPRPCPVCYNPVELAIENMPSHPSTSPVLHNLTYIIDENPTKYEPHGGSDFGGYPSLKERNDSFDIQESMSVHCGFVKGSKPGRNTDFDIDEADLKELEQFHDVIVASAIFGNYDKVQQPINVSESAKENIPFYMFIDELTEAHMRSSSVLDDSMKVGVWRIIVVHNVPYSDARRNGKVPKLLLHRIVPNVRYSIWIDGKLQLVVDPYQVLERFLWRENATLAISKHYKRFDVFEEAEANKAAKKYDNASIDYQIEFYRKEGLTPYSRKKFPITSDVPEGCVIVREHIPITNLFTCLWFNEVDRFTSRDQLSFSTVRDKLMAKVGWSLYMFQDCERRNFVIQNYHNGEGPRPPPPVIPRPPLPPRRVGSASRIPVRSSPRRGKRHHRKVGLGSRGKNTIFLG